jgi:hypothetical protein
MATGKDELDALDALEKEAKEYDKVGPPRTLTIRQPSASKLS